jgi:hypothetical protein
MLCDIIEKDELLNYYFQKGFDDKKVSGIWWG